jgi:hypothetical protein
MNMDKLYADVEQLRRRLKWKMPKPISFCPSCGKETHRGPCMAAKSQAELRRLWEEQKRK